VVVFPSPSTFPNEPQGQYNEEDEGEFVGEEREGSGGGVTLTSSPPSPSSENGGVLATTVDVVDDDEALGVRTGVGEPDFSTSNTVAGCPFSMPMYGCRRPPTVEKLPLSGDNTSTFTSCADVYPS